MPIYEYLCKSCEHQFEALVLRGEEPTKCTACGREALERRLSLPAVKSETTHALAMRAAKRRDQKQGTDRVQDQLAYERSHED